MVNSPNGHQGPTFTSKFLSVFIIVFQHLPRLPSSDYTLQRMFWSSSFPLLRHVMTTSGSETRSPAAVSWPLLPKDLNWCNFSPPTSYDVNDLWIPDLSSVQCPECQFRSLAARAPFLSFCIHLFWYRFSIESPKKSCEHVRIIIIIQMWIIAMRWDDVGSS